MRSRHALTILAAPLVVMTACNSIDPMRIRLFHVTKQGTRCVVDDVCFASERCELPLPYTFAPCGDLGDAGAGNTFPGEPDRRLYGQVGDRCFARPYQCDSPACLLAETKCPPSRPAIERPRPPEWKITAVGSDCTFVEVPITPTTPHEEPFTMPCPDWYDDGVEGLRVNRWSRSWDDTCEVTEIPCPRDAICDPDEPTYVPCPR